MGLFNKKELKRIEELEKENAEYLSKIEQLGAKELFDIQNEIKELQQTKLDVEKDIQEKSDHHCGAGGHDRGSRLPELFRTDLSGRE